MYTNKQFIDISVIRQAKYIIDITNRKKLANNEALIGTDKELIVSYNLNVHLLAR